MSTSDENTHGLSEGAQSSAAPLGGGEGETLSANSAEATGQDMALAGGIALGNGEVSPLWFAEKPSKPARLLPPLALAYIGDAVFEVAVRQHVMAQLNLRPHHLHGQSTKYVAAKAQAKLLSLLEPNLTEDEKDVVRQGRNAKSGVPKNGNVIDYRHATAFESLVGYLYYTGAHERLRSLISYGFDLLDSETKSI